MFITALFITAKIRKQPKHPYTHTQTQTHTRMYTFKYIMEYYSAIHRLCNCSAGCSCYLSGTGGDMYWGEGENPGVSKSHNFKCFLIVSIWSIMKLIKILVKYRLLGRKVMTNLDDILKSRDIILPAKFHLVKAMVFPVVMHGCESWTIKKAECQRINASELWCWRRLLRVPWTARRSNQSILNEISPECSLKGLMLKLKLQYFGHLM